MESPNPACLTRANSGPQGTLLEVFPEASHLAQPIQCVFPEFGSSWKACY